MKKIICVLLLSSLAFLPACETPNSQVTVLPVGPNPARGGAEYGQGYLMVYSAWSAFNNNYTTDHSGYSILANDGKLLRRVHNHIEGDFTAEPPTRVALLPGTYRVKAESQAYGIINVPVVIKSGEITSVYLDAASQPPQLNSARANVVKLPDGEIVGWAAN